MKKTPLRRRSKKREKEQKVYLKNKAEYLELHPICEVCGEKPSYEIHHVQPVGQGGKLTDKSNFLACCRSPWGCHEWIHRNPSASREKGYLI